MILLSRHGEYDFYNEWEKWRLTYEGGIDFRNAYLQKFSSRETDSDFQLRKSITYTPAHAKAAINDVKNSIFQRIADVTRKGGSESYQNAMRGLNGGVDRRGSTMNYFIGHNVLPEILTMKKVGIYVDRAKSEAKTLADKMPPPYLYTYKVEDILNWKYRDDGEPWQFEALLLRDWVSTLDDFGLPGTVSSRYRLLQLQDNKVKVTLFNEKGRQDSEVSYLDIPRIPFVAPEITESLLKDTADYQIALLNAESSDLGYILKSNFPFYVEQDDNRINSHLKQDQTTGTSATDKEIEVGATQGRRYSKGMNQPAFIAPPSEPIRASMEKEQQIKDDIRLLVNIALSNVKPKQASAESKMMDERGLESGLSYIGLELEHAERQVAQIWDLYENKGTVATVKYPSRYSLKSDADTIKEAKELNELKFAVPSDTYRKSISKRVADLLLGTNVAIEDLDKIHSEVESAEVLIVDPDTIRMGVENAILSNKLAAVAMGLPENSVKDAAQDHADRAKRIAEAQASVNPATPQLNEKSKSQNDVDKNDTDV